MSCNEKGAFITPMSPEHEFSRRCYRKGFRATESRLRIVRCAFEMNDGFSAEDLVEAFAGDEPRVSRATIYRTLSLLVSVGMLSQNPGAFVFRFNASELG